MKSFREYINLIENIQSTPDEDIELFAHAIADEYWSGKIGMTSATEKVKMAHQIIQAVEDGRLSLEDLRQDLADLRKQDVEEQLEETEVDPVRRIEELFRNK